MNAGRVIVNTTRLFARPAMRAGGCTVHNAFVTGLLNMQSATSIRSYHASSLVAAKAKKGGGGKKGGAEEEEEGGLPDLNDTKKKMEQVVDKFSQEMSKLKVGRASVDMFNGIQVGSYGAVSSAGQVSVKNATTVSIAVYDPSMVKTVADAIKDCGMGFTPTVENNNVTVFVPKPSKESRELLIKNASKSAEKVRKYTLTHG